MNDCIFCKIVKGEIPCHKLYENSKCIAFLDITPVNKGHALIIPKQHYENIYDLPEDLLKEMISITKKLAIAVKKAVNADGINIGINNEQSAGQAVFHAHIHIMPRFSGDGFNLWKGSKLPEDVMRKVQEAIKTNI